MKKISIFLNILLLLVFIWTVYNLIYFSITLHYNIDTYHYLLNVDEEEAISYKSYILRNGITVAFDSILVISSIAALFFFNYRFDGVSLREKIATRLAESKEKRAQYRVEKAAADKQAEIEDKQKKLEQLQNELDELKKD